jgi:hypothetical protein
LRQETSEAKRISCIIKPARPTARTRSEGRLEADIPRLRTAFAIVV